MIDVANLTKKFNDFVAVDTISFRVDEGDIFAFLGPNGAGKSTTVKMLTTLLRPSSGKILIAGKDAGNPANHQAIRKILGVLFQDSTLDDELTAYENMELHAVLYGLSVRNRRKEISTLLDLVELQDARHTLVKAFSGGMKRRLEMARTLLHKPDILFLDEPTLGLDPQVRLRIWDYLIDSNQREKLTIFFTTHYMEEAEKMARHIAIIDQGRIITQGTLADCYKQTKTPSLEEAFLALTGKSLRQEEASSLERLRRVRGVYNR